MKPNFISIFLPLLLGVSVASYADTYTYKYTGSAMSSGDHLVVTFTTAAKLAANKSYGYQRHYGSPKHNHQLSA